MLLEIAYAGKIKRKGGIESSDQAVEEKGSHWSWINTMQKTSTVKRSFLIKKHMAHWRINIRIRLSFILFFVSKFLLMVKTILLWLISSALNCFCSWLKFKNSFNCCRKNNRLFLRNNQLFWVWQQCEEILLIAILIFYSLPINSKGESWSKNL